MRIIDRKEFLTLTPPFLYAKSLGNTGLIYNSLNVCEKIIQNDWFYINVNGLWEEWDGKDLKSMKFTPVVDEEGDHFSSRDGCFDENDMFIVWTKEEVEQIINLLSIIT